MVELLDIAIAVHEICLKDLIDQGISKPHDFDQHLGTSALYAQAINEAGKGNVTGPEVAKAIIDVVKWDRKSKWPGHPDPQKVIKKL